MAKHSSHALIKGLGAAALITAAAAGYYFNGPKGKQHRKAAGKWAKAAQKDLAGKLKDMEGVSRTGYDKAVQEVMGKYRQVKNIDPAELRALGADLKRHWDNITKQAKAPAAAKSKKPARKKLKAA